MEPKFDSGTLELSLPANIKPGEEKLFEMVLAGEVRACEVKILENVLANRELILWQNGEMLEEGFAWPWLKDQLYSSFNSRLKFHIKKLARRTVTVRDPVLWCMDGYSTGGYFHWITDILPRLWMAKKYLPEVKFAIPDYFITKWPFCKDFFQLLGVENFLIISNYSQYKIKKLIMPTRAGNPFFLQPTPIKEGVKWLREAALKASSKAAGERIYISRSKASYRKVLNEADLYPVLKKYNFTIINLEDYKLSEQISICNNAEVLLGLHGAGLSNLVFLPPGKKVIEIRPSKANPMYTCFFTLCPFFNIQYNYILCDYAPEKLSTDLREVDYSVRVSASDLDKSLSELLK